MNYLQQGGGIDRRRMPACIGPPPQYVMRGGPTLSFRRLAKMGVPIADLLWPKQYSTRHIKCVGPSPAPSSPGNAFVCKAATPPDLPSVSIALSLSRMRQGPRAYWGIFYMARIVRKFPLNGAGVFRPRTMSFRGWYGRRACLLA